MASELKELTEDSSFDQMPSLILPAKKPRKFNSPNLRRHFSEGGIDLSKLRLEDKDIDEANTSNGNDTPTPPNQLCSFDISW